MMETTDYLEDKITEGLDICHKWILGPLAISTKRNVVFAQFSVLKTFGLH